MAQLLSLVATAPVGGSGMSQKLEIQSNQVASVMHSYVPPEADLIGQPVRAPFVEITIGTNSYSYLGDMHPVVSGPATVQLKIFNTNTWFQTPSSTFCTIQVTEAQPQLSPSTSVVIPTDAKGPVRIILESSVDMLNWADALPGTYGSTTTNRFFRVRAVRQ
jgi:hypothetical protein